MITKGTIALLLVALVAWVFWMSYNWLRNPNKSDKPKKSMKKNTGIFKMLFLAFISLSVISCTDVAPGHKGVEVEWGGKTNMNMVYDEGMHFGTSWIVDDMIEYDCREQTMIVNESFLDYDGLETPVQVYLYYNPIPGSVNKLHTQIGQDFRETKLTGVFKGAVKTVIAQHKALLLNREDRPVAEKKITDILNQELPTMFVECKRVQITDIDLPTGIKNMIQEAKIQDERNKLAEKKELEKKNLANAEIARAKGEYEAATYDAKTKEILSQPKMLELKSLENEAIMWEGYLKHGTSPFGNGNMYGITPAVIKGLN